MALLVKAAFEGVVELQKFHVMRPAQLVRRLRTIWQFDVKLPHADEVAAAETPCRANELDRDSDLIATLCRIRLEPFRLVQRN